MVTHDKEGTLPVLDNDTLNTFFFFFFFFFLLTAEITTWPLGKNGGFKNMGVQDRTLKLYPGLRPIKVNISFQKGITLKPCLVHPHV